MRSSKNLLSLAVPSLVGLGCLTVLILLSGILFTGQGQTATLVFVLLAIAVGGCLWSAWHIRLAWRQRRALLAERPEAFAIGATVRAWLPTIVCSHLALNTVVLVILGLAIGVSVVDESAGMLIGFLLSAPLFLVFPFLLLRLSARLRPSIPRNPKGWDQGSGYFVLLGFAALWLGIVGSMQGIEAWRLQRAEVIDDLHWAELSAYQGRNTVLGVKEVMPAPVPTVRSYGWSVRVRGANRTSTTHYYRIDVVPLAASRDTLSVMSADTLDHACVWLGMSHSDVASSVPNDSATAGLGRTLRQRYAQRLMDTEPRWLREIIWPDVSQHNEDYYRRAIGGLSDAERGCRPVVFQAVAAPPTLRTAAWQRLALYFSLGNLIPLLLLCGYGFWRLDRLGADEILMAKSPHHRAPSRPLHPLQRIFQCSDEDREHYRAGRLSDRQHQRIQHRLWLAIGGTLIGMVIAGVWTVLAIGLLWGIWTSPNYGWIAHAASLVGLLLGLLFLIGLPLEQWRQQRLIRQDLCERRVERLTGHIQRHRHYANNTTTYGIIMAGQPFTITEAIYNALNDGAVYDLYRLPRTRRLLAILPAG